MMAFGKITAIVLIVQDLNKVMTFYRDVLGLPSTCNDDVSYGFKLGDQDLVVLQHSAAIEMTGEPAISLTAGVNHTSMPCINCDDIDATCNELTAKGLTFIKPPKDQAWGRRTAYFADPEGHIWELYQEIPAK